MGGRAGARHGHADEGHRAARLAPLPDLYRREAWTFLPQTGYDAGVIVLERLDHFAAEGEIAVPITLPATEYRLAYWLVGRIGRTAGRWVFGQFSPIMSAGDLERLVAKAQAEGTLLGASV